MTSPFSFENWDELLDPPITTPTAASTTTAPSPSTATSSGEFQPFLAVGFSVAGGGDRKSFALLHGGRVLDLCCGVIGTSKFCLKTTASCEVLAHAKKFEPDAFTFYLKENEHRAFFKPSFSAPGLSEATIDMILSIKRTVQETVSILEECRREGAELTPELPREETNKDSINLQVDSEILVLSEQGSFELESPKFTTAEAGIFSSTPHLSFDEEDEGENNIFNQLADSHSIALVNLLRDFHDRFSYLKTKWTHTFVEVDASHAIMISDLKTVNDRISSIKHKLKMLSDSYASSEAHTTLQLNQIFSDWHKITELSMTTMNNVQLVRQEHTSLAEAVTTTNEERDLQLQTLNSAIAGFDTRMSAMDRCLKEFEKRFTIIFPIIRGFKQRQPGEDTGTSDRLKQQLQDLAEKVEALDHMAWQQINSVPSPTSVTQPILHESELQDIRHQIKVLQHRIVGGGVKIGSKVFQSFEDVQVWVKSDLPIRRYGLFVDAVSILDFFSCLGHIDAENQVSTLHNANKAGFTSIYESRVATSVQNIFPRIFGKGDSHQYLPAIRQPDRWDDGTDGLAYQITRGMTDVETQLSSAIDTVLERYPEARTIASQCLFKAKRFVVDLCSFMSKDYFKWRARGHGKQEAWNMTSLCVRRVFEEIHTERVVARDIYDPNDLEFTTAKMLWATWKAHGVMEQYLKHHFYEHPSISAVLARHLADNYVKPEVNPAVQVTALEKTIKSYGIRLDKLENKKKGKDKPKDKDEEQQS